MEANEWGEWMLTMGFLVSNMSNLPSFASSQPHKPVQTGKTGYKFARLHLHGQYFLTGSYSRGRNRRLVRLNRRHWERGVRLLRRNKEGHKAIASYANKRHMRELCSSRSEHARGEQECGLDVFQVILSFKHLHFFKVAALKWSRAGSKMKISKKKIPKPAIDGTTWRDEMIIDCGLISRQVVGL